MEVNSIKLTEQDFKEVYRKSKTENKFKKVIEFFNNVANGEFVTRKMFLEDMTTPLSIRYSSQGVQPYETYRCYLMRAGYLYDPTIRKKDAPLYNYTKKAFPFGIYFKVKNIPKNITLGQLIKEAYPERK